MFDGDFEKFRGRPTAPLNERVHITLNARGVIFMNRNAHRIWGSPNAVLLYYSRSRRQIGLKPVDRRGHNAFPIKEGNGGRLIHAISFIRKFGINVERTHRFNDPTIATDGSMVLDLKPEE